MKIKYCLVDNLMTDDPNDDRAQVTGYEAIIEAGNFDYMTCKDSCITTTAANANCQEITEAYEYLLKQGYGINTEWINARPSILNVFTEKMASFDSSRYQLKFKHYSGKRYNQTARNVKVEKEEQLSNAAVPSGSERHFFRFGQRYNYT
jgi:hypothetical protein